MNSKNLKTTGGQVHLNSADYWVETHGFGMVFRLVNGIVNQVRCPAECETPLLTKGTKMKIVIFIYNGITMLDAIGPYEVLKDIDDAEVFFVAE
ncbi:MAG TPA: hypothetical protein VGM24_10350, partial [Puia sp.]